jgi:hypothetical protein
MKAPVTRSVRFKKIADNQKIAIKFEADSVSALSA